MINKSVLNINKNYQTTSSSMLFNGNPGLFDTINMRFPEVEKLYKQMKKQDWDEAEFDYSPCKGEFKTVSRSISDMMIINLIYQWETDSLAANNIAPIVAQFQPSDELWSAWVEITKNEILHARTYSKIIEKSFDNPNEVLSDVINKLEPMRRLKAVSDAFAEVKKVSARLATGELSHDSDEAMDAAMLYITTMLTMERVQFMPSFLVSFAIGEIGLFLPAVLAIQKIAIDEYTVHVKLGKVIFSNEVNTTRGKASFERIKPKLATIIEEVGKAEESFTDYLFSEGRELPGLNADLCKDFMYLGLNDVYTTFGMDNPFKVVTKNPLPFVNNWLDINNLQGSPQETRLGNYLLSNAIEDDSDEELDIDF